MAACPVHCCLCGRRCRNDDNQLSRKQKKERLPRPALFYTKCVDDDDDDDDDDETDDGPWATPIARAPTGRIQVRTRPKASFRTHRASTSTERTPTMRMVETCDPQAPPSVPPSPHLSPQTSCDDRLVSSSSPGLSVSRALSQSVSQSVSQSARRDTKHKKRARAPATAPLPQRTKDTNAEDDTLVHEPHHDGEDDSPTQSTASPCSRGKSRRRVLSTPRPVGPRGLAAWGGGGTKVGGWFRVSGPEAEAEAEAEAEEEAEGG